MNIYLAPMEGMTGYLYRNALHHSFPDIDRFYTPFIATNQNGKMKSRDKNDILPEHNQGINLVPQILSNQATDFCCFAKQIADLGYQEINLNLGCPSGTVAAKRKGAGQLADTEALQRFLEEIFAKSPVELSIKTRIGIESGEEFGKILEIYNQYPLKELIIHPRTLRDYYKNTPDLAVFEEARKVSRAPVCYNGDIFTREDMEKFCQRFPEVDHVMLGRGILRNPNLAGEIKMGRELSMENLRTFHDEILHGYQEIFSGDRNVLFKMKELWANLSPFFPKGEKELKKIRKADRVTEYELAVNRLFAQEVEK